MKIHTVELLVSDPSPFEFEIAISKLRRHKSPRFQIPTELIQVGGENITV
jgi:hypothetical protein